MSYCMKPDKETQLANIRTVAACCFNKKCSSVLAVLLVFHLILPRCLVTGPRWCSFILRASDLPSFLFTYPFTHTSLFSPPSNPSLFSFFSRTQKYTVSILYIHIRCHIFISHTSALRLYSLIIDVYVWKVKIYAHKCNVSGEWK